MKYFNNFPKVLDFDGNNKYIAITNLLTRVSMLPEQINNASLYYEYDVQDTDTPEIVASKYYGSVEDFWVVMFTNQFLDPQWDWPLSSRNLDLYIVEKYGSLSNASSQVAFYEKIITTKEINGIEPEQVERYRIDETEYNDNTQYGGVLYSWNNKQLSVVTSKRIVSNYDYEIEKNQQKRRIKILNNVYLGTLQTNFEQLIKQ